MIHFWPLHPASFDIFSLGVTVNLLLTDINASAEGPLLGDEDLQNGSGDNSVLSEQLGLLAQRMTDPNPATRITANAALQVMERLLENPGAY